MTRGPLGAQRRSGASSCDFALGLRRGPSGLHIPVHLVSMIWPRFRSPLQGWTLRVYIKPADNNSTVEGADDSGGRLIQDNEDVVGLTFMSLQFVKPICWADDSDATTMSTRRSSDAPPSTTVVLLELGLGYAPPSTTVVLLDLGRQARTLGEGGLALRLTGSACWFVGFVTPPEALLPVETQTTFCSRTTS